MSITSAVAGSIASSRGGLVGIGVFSAPIRVTGWSSDQKQRSPISAAISAPYPSRRGDERSGEQS